MSRYELIPCSVPGCNRRHGVRLVSAGRTLGERLWEKVDKSGGPDACWPWLGYRDRKGYGEISVGGRRPIGTSTKAHRAAFVLSGGVVPDDQLVLHRCDNPPCCNPAHLFAGTYADNAQDMVDKGRQPEHMRPRSHCRRGHAFTAANTYTDPTSGDRRCRTCRAFVARRSRATPRKGDGLVAVPGGTAGSHRPSPEARDGASGRISRERAGSAPRNPSPRDGAGLDPLRPRRTPPPAAGAPLPVAGPTGQVSARDMGGSVRGVPVSRGGLTTSIDQPSRR